MSTVPPRPQPVTQVTIDRLYDEVTGMRNDVTGMRSDLRELTVTVRSAVDQGRDHETRIRVIERDGATAEDVEKLTLRVTSVERRAWMAAGAVAAVSVGAGILPYVTR